MQYPFWSKYLFHIRNGGSIKSAREGMKFKRMGVRKGIPDLFLSIPHIDWHGFYIELKKKGGKPSLEQVENGKAFEDLGYKFLIIDDIEVFIDEVNEYMLKILQ
jgi:hypothetical protein